jgi:DNA polymerase bacteriophage-type
MLITIDFETYFSGDYSLRTMNPILYIRDPRFKVHGVGIKINSHDAFWTTKLPDLDWDRATVVGHNLLFDGLILREKYGISPFRWFDTQSAAAAWLPAGSKTGLDAVATALGLGSKIKGSLDKVKGVRDLSPEQYQELGEYCIQDVDLTFEICRALAPLIPTEEHYIMHMTTRMGVEACIELDKKVLQEELATVLARKEATVEGFDRSILSSNQQYAALLEKLAGSYPTKQNSKSVTIPAVSKNDPEYIAFKMDNPELQPLFEAREEIKSTIIQRRTELFLKIADTGPLPMPYRYYGAHTGRFSGASGLNVQNLPNLRKSKLRKALVAPKGHVIHVADSAQIELRLQLWFTDQIEAMTALHEGGDLYKETAAALFDKPIDKVTKEERGMGKATLLGCQYGMGPKKYRAYMASGPLGLPPMFISEQEAQDRIRGFRTKYNATVAKWYELDGYLPAMTEPNCDLEMGPVRFKHEHILFPNGMPVDYSGLELSEDGGWMYGGKSRIWGGSFLENIVQGLARVILTEQALAIDQMVLRVVGWTHDELLCIGPEKYAEENQKKLIEIMSTPPRWAPGLLLGAEGGYDRAYTK